MNVTVTAVQLSVATTAPVLAAGTALAQLTDMLVGMLIILGTSVSLIVTGNDQLVTLPLASVTVNVLVVTPTGKSAPLGKPAV